MNKLFISVVAILLLSQTNTYSQTLVTINEVPNGDIIIENLSDENLILIDADYGYIRDSDNKVIFEKDGVAIKEIDMLKNSSLNASNKIRFIDVVFFHVNKYLNKNNIELFITGLTTDDKYFNIITDETGTIYFEEIDYSYFSFYPTSISMSHTVGEDSFTKFVKFDNDLSKKDESLTSYKVYPNPTSNFINVEGNFESIKIYDVSGKLALEDHTTGKTINVSSLAKGEYILNLYIQSNKVGSHKIIID